MGYGFFMFYLLLLLLSAKMSSSSSSSSFSVADCNKTQQKLKPLLNELWCKALTFSGIILFLVYVILFYPPDYKSYDLLPLSQRKWQPIPSPEDHKNPPMPPTNISHIVFGIVGSMNTWKFKRFYTESWWRPNVTRGYLFVDRPPSGDDLPWPDSSPPVRVNEDLRKLPAYRRIRQKIQVRIFRTILETFKEGDKDVRWYVMADDDTVLFIDNLVEVLARYDHRKHYYIGMSSECVKSNYHLSFGMAFGGAGYALSYPLIELLSKRLDACIDRYPYLGVSDHMLYSCLTDLGYAITQERGFHQIDLHRDISGFLSAHPQTPILSLHHIDSIDPIFPSMSRPEAINHLMEAAKADHSRLVQQTICYHRPTNWTFSISWGYSAHIYENILPRNFLRKPLETFVPWSRANPPVFMFNTRWVTDNPCEAPHVFFLESIGRDGDTYVSNFAKKRPRNLTSCSFSGNHTADSISRVQVFSPATVLLEVGGIDCCDVQLATKNTTQVKYRPCLSGEVMA